MSRGRNDHDMPTEMPDTGCEYAPSCVRCPYEFCLYDDPETFKAVYVIRPRRRQAQELRKAGLSPGEIAERLGISERQVFADLKEEETCSQKRS